MEETEAEAMLRGQADIWKYMFGFADSMALKCAVELRIADIIHSHAPTDHMITLSQIASHLVAPSPDITCLKRIMRLLVRRNIFAVHHPSQGGEPVYGLTYSSRWLLHDSEMSLAPMLVMENHPSLMAPWHYFSQCWIMHDWNDCDCIKILKNCRKAIPERGGKIMIVDIVLEPSGDGVLDDIRLVLI
ncbi:(R S)-reticuline 7-O-methyltransferase-like [Prunus yedoensis var. nudiflora]|uniref:(R S)-reticuline 7-O-methyltransferase-like n=1 Tax=Prunus yedoensis var. nudiflora TaxID=2094558 RepID=A0A314Y9R9_PRUYE|nr:(R S)-reticuline 7-O-methyltransferase-like [Prunus yedoensis var. nudiflora]